MSLKDKMNSIPNEALVQEDNGILINIKVEQSNHLKHVRMNVQVKL